ncbi:MAG: Nramp family divalent metal transporter [Candidatus Marinimicrobia bacterium]|nr:Nramp family divalent metal transporter [Candidatus Neomarinimicrobiota bacterium]MCF7828916.1 Nramp family divalent metal transporter [Candidatus Neomarinimicrobiota bacterium]MCF7879876.1 Nramp family divalent metal transporter [Candidatus Neomarinimicrobiota bacterium]
MQTNEKRLWDRARETIKNYGPALFVIGATIGTGSVSSLVVSGANHGVDLLWVLIPSCMLFWVLITSISRLTFASGQTFITAVNENIGRTAGFYIVLAIIIGQFSSNIGVLGIVAEASAAWLDVNFLLMAVFWSGLIYILIFFGQYQSFERVLIVLVTILGLSFIIDTFFAHPSAKTVIRGLVPVIPEGGTMVVAAMVGTTLAGSVIVMRSFIVTDKGWTLADLRKERKDSIASAILIFVISGVIMIVAAATMHAQGIRVNEAIDMAFTLEPLLGEFAATVFVVGIVAAGLSSAFPNALVSIWSIADYFNLSRDPKATHFRLLALVFCGAGIIAPLTGGKPVMIQIASLAIQAALMPLLVLFIIILLNKKEVVGDYTNTPVMNFLCGITLLYSGFMGYQAVIGIIETVNAI